MTNINQNTDSSLKGFALLLVLLVMAVFASSSVADSDCPVCPTTCDSYLVNEIHTLQPGMDSTNLPDPIPDFCVCWNEKCDSLEATFVDWSQGVIRTWEWDFGDPASGADNYSSLENPAHKYFSSGTYTVTLTVTGYGDPVTIAKEQVITVETAPHADFVFTPDRGCVSTVFQFEDRSTDATSWEWALSDGTISFAQNFTHQFSAPGDYTVRLAVWNDCGGDKKYDTLTVTVGEEPTAAFDYELVPYCDSADVDFFDRSIDADSWYWEFGDGSTSTDQNPSHTYYQEGRYAVTLTVTNKCGDDDTTRTIEVVLPDPPIADFSSDLTQVCRGGIVTFTNLSTGATSWLWSFGDGTTSTDSTPVHTYSQAGTYTVSLRAINDCGYDPETKTEFITVLSGPTADFQADPTRGTPTLSVTFTDLSTSSLGIYSWAWDFGDGGSSDQQHPVHDYTAAGTYTVSLIVVDPCGADTATKVEYIYVVDTCSIDVVAEPVDGCAPLTVWFGGSSFGDCEITSWIWDFGDPASGNDNTASTREAQHTYTDPGAYTVTLTAIDGVDTMVVTKTNLVMVHRRPNAYFDVIPKSGTAPLDCSFYDKSASYYGLTGWEWDFGDPASGSANKSTDQNPVHTFDAFGVYTVTLIASDMCGSDTTTETVYVAAALEVIKAVDRPVAGAGENVLYTLTVRNNGTEPSGGIMLVDTIPDMSSYVLNSLTGPGTYVSGSNTVEWTIPGLNPGGEATVTFEVFLGGPFPQLPATISNYAIATTGVEYIARSFIQTYVSNIVETIVSIPTGSPTIDKDVNTSLANPGDTLTYTITVTNGGPSAASGLKVYDAPPERTVFLGNITGGGIYNPTADSVFWDLGTLASFSDTTVSFQVTVDPDAPSGLIIPNTALYDTDFLGGDQSDTVITLIHTEPIVISKTVSRPSGMIGDLVRFTIKIQNFTDQQFDNLVVLDTMPVGIVYIAGTSLLDGAGVADPAGTNPYSWALGNLPSSSTVILEYTSLISSSANPGLHDNIARAEATQNGILTRSNRAVAQIYVLSQTISGSIRGRVIVDCDGDGVADMDNAPSGMDIYLDDGSQSKVNDTGMFYFSTVRPGERVVALDERDLNGFVVPEGAQASVFVHVHESGESYVLFRVCPDYPRLDIQKKASIIPTVKVTKSATINPRRVTDSLGVLVDYRIDIKSNGLADPTRVSIIDTYPEDMNLIPSEQDELVPIQNDHQLVYEITAAEEQLQKSVQYSLKDITPGVRRFLTNKVHLEGHPALSSEMPGPLVSEPAEVAVGPFVLAPPVDVTITLTPALFITSKAFLQPPAFPLLKVVADSIRNYPDAEIKVDGHTDLRPIHTVRFPSNWELGEARAKAVVDWLVDSANISGDRMSFESFAATRPVVTDVPTTSVALQPNRRTEVIIKAGVQGFLAPGVSPTDRWENSTSLALIPNRFDTLFEAVQNKVAVDLDDSWEIVLIVVNESDISAEVTSFTDVLPMGTEYIVGSASINGTSIPATVTENVISLELDQILPLQKLEVRYRIRAIDSQQPSGGGAASIELKIASGVPVVQSSNVVKFE